MVSGYVDSGVVVHNAVTYKTSRFISFETSGVDAVLTNFTNEEVPIVITVVGIVRSVVELARASVCGFWFWHLVFVIGTWATFSTFGVPEFLR